jgi:cell division control protein 6
MGIFEGLLKEGESLFVDEISLDFDYIPKILKYRENEQKEVAVCISPLMQGRQGKNLFVTGSPGIGKTAAIKNVLEELKEETDDVIPLYINCWKRDSAYKIILDIAEQINYKWVHNKRTDELLKEVIGVLNKKAVVFVLDEIDKLTEKEILYNLVEEVYKKTIIFITNKKNFLLNLDQRISSRLTAETLIFRPYNYEETKGILKQRLEHAFVRGVWEDNALKVVVDLSFKLADIRTGLFLLKEAGRIAEEKSAKKITEEDAKKAVDKLKDFKIMDSEDLDYDMKIVLDLVKRNTGKDVNVKNLYGIYKSEGGKSSYRTFHRRIEKLIEDKLIEIEGVKGPGGSAIVKYRRLGEFR